MPISCIYNQTIKYKTTITKMNLNSRTKIIKYYQPGSPIYKLVVQQKPTIKYGAN